MTVTVVNNNTGELTAADFPLFVNGFSIEEGVATTTLSAGAYTVSQTDQEWYEASDWGGDCAADGTITMVLGETYECTITNDDQIIPEAQGTNDSVVSGRKDDFEKTDRGSSESEDDEPADNEEAVKKALQEKIIELLKQIIAILLAQQVQ